MKQPIAFGRFGALCPVAEFLGLPVKKVRRLRDMGLIRLPGGLTRPEDMTEDWMNHAHRLIDEHPATSPAWRPRRDGAGIRRPPVRAVAPLVGDYDTWLAAQGGRAREITKAVDS